MGRLSFSYFLVVVGLHPQHTAATSCVVCSFAVAVADAAAVAVAVAADNGDNWPPPSVSPTLWIIPFNLSPASSWSFMVVPLAIE